MSTLLMRISRIQNSQSMPTIIMGPGCFLPQQTMKLTSLSKPFCELLCKLHEAKLEEAEETTLAIMVIAPDKSLLKHGIEASVDSIFEEEDGKWQVTLRGERIVRFIGALEEEDYQEGPGAFAERAERKKEEGASKGWFTARVHPVDLPALDEQETTGSRALELVSGEIKALVECWLDLVRSTQILLDKPEDELAAFLAQLGPLPPVHAYSQRAFWVGQLLNPGPAAKVALEMRPRLLAADTALQRLQIAKHGLLDSIQRLKGAEQGKPLFGDSTGDSASK